MVDVCVLGPSKSFLQEALVRDLDPRTHQGGDDVVFDFSMRVRHAATSDDVEDGSRRLRAHGVQSLELSAGVQAAWQRQPDATRRLSCLAGGTAETQHGGS